MSEKLKVCPFCGKPPKIEPWHGGPKAKRLISCDDDFCPVSPSITGNTEKEAAASWNTRAPIEITVKP